MYDYFRGHRSSEIISNSAYNEALSPGIHLHLLVEVRNLSLFPLHNHLTAEVLLGIIFGLKLL